MKRPSRWSTSSTIQTAQGRGDIASWRRPRSRRVRSQYSASSLMSATSLILSPSHKRSGSTPWLLVLLSPCKSRWTCPEQKLWAKLLKLTSSDTYRAESHETQYHGDLKQEGHPHIIPGKGNHVFQYRDLFCFNCCTFSACHCLYIVEWSYFLCVAQIIIYLCSVFILRNPRSEMCHIQNQFA